MIRKWISAWLIALLLCASASAAAEAGVAESDSVEEAVALADWAGDTGLTIEGEPPHEDQKAPEEAPARAEELAPQADLRAPSEEAGNEEPVEFGAEAAESGPDGKDASVAAGSDDGSEGELQPALELSASKATIGLKEKCTPVAATLMPEGYRDEVTWKSSNVKIVKVNARTGEMTGVKKGTAIITVSTAKGLEKTCRVTVKAAPKSVKLSEKAVKLSVGQVLSLKATLSNGSGSTLRYASSRGKTVAVSDTGVITALKTGTATITVKTFNNRKATCKVTVLPEPTQVFLPDKLTVAEKERSALKVKALAADGTVTTAGFTFSAEDGTGRITVDPHTGEVMGVSQGTATVRVVTHNGISTHLDGGGPVETVCAVTVVEGPSAVGLEAKKITIGLKQKYALNPRLLSSDGREMKGACSVAVSDPKKLSVTSKGVVKGLAVGTCNVTFTAFNGVKASCAVKIVKAPTKVSFTDPAPVIGVGQTVKLSVRYPQNTMASCTFSSSAAKVVSVDSEGYITGRKVGTAVIKARTHNGKTAKVTVSVTRGPEFIALNGDYELVFDPLKNSYSTLYTKALSPGKTFQIAYENEYQTSGDISAYESLNPDIATVSETGLVTAVAPGTAIIAVRSTGGAQARLKVTVSGKLPPVIEFTAASAVVQSGQTVAAPTLKGENIGASDLAAARYESGDPGVFTVDWSESEAGWMITGLAPGEATLIANAQGTQARMNVTVAPAEAIKAIRFESELVYMDVGDTYAPVVLDESGNSVEALFSTDDTGVVTVGEDGRLIAAGEGSALITASFGGLSASMRAQVRAGSVTVTLNAESLTLGVGQRFALRAAVNGDGSSPDMSYSSSNDAVATVNRNGRIIARGVGAAVVTATARGGVSASCAVNVAPCPTHLSVEPSSVCMNLDEKGTRLSWSFGAPDEIGSVTFASSDTSVVTVDEDGYVAFRSSGRAVVSVVTDNGLTARVDVTVLPETPVSTTPRYRLFAAYSYFDSSYSGYLPFTKNNARSMVKAFGKSGIGDLTYSTKVMGNPSKTQLLSGIAGFFAGTGDNDVSIVYLCSHGHMTGDYTGYRMSLPGYTGVASERNYYLTSGEIMSCISRIRGSVVLILDSCYSGAFLQDMQGALAAQGGRIAVLTAASNTRATYYNVKDTGRAVDFFSFFLLQGLGYNARDGWWNSNAKGSRGSYPGYLAADQTGNRDGIVTLGEFFDFASKCIATNIPNYMKMSWYWGDKTRVQKPRYYAGALDLLAIYQPKR